MWPSRDGGDAKENRGVKYQEAFSGLTPAARNLGRRGWSRSYLPANKQDGFTSPNFGLEVKLSFRLRGRFIVTVVAPSGNTTPALPGRWTFML